MAGNIWVRKFILFSRSKHVNTIIRKISKERSNLRKFEFLKFKTLVIYGLYSFLEFDSYEEAIQAVRDDKVFAAVINADYIQWHQEDMHSGSKALAVGYLIDITIPIRMNVVIYGNIAEVWNCLDRFRNEIIETPRRKYFRYVDVSKYVFIVVT